MKLVTRISMLSGLLLTLAAATAVARPAPEKQPIGSGITVKSLLFSSVPTTCQLGVTGQAAWIINYLLPPNDAYYTLLEPASCTSCGPTHSLKVTAAHVALQFVNDCAQPAIIGVYGAQTIDGCNVPDLNNPLCPPISVNLQPGAGFWDITIPVPDGCCIQNNAFLMVNFVASSPDCGDSSTRPRLLTVDGCAGCTSYNFYPGGADDLCVDIGLPGNPIMYVDAECCLAVPTLPKSWGRVKSLYR